MIQQKKIKENVELDKIIAQIEGEHITALPETQQNNNAIDKDLLPPTKPGPKIKQEDAYGMDLILLCIFVQLISVPHTYLE